MDLKFTDRWNVLRQGKPGHRFRDRYHRNQRSTSSQGWWSRLIRMVFAAAAFMVGVVLVFIPGPAIVFFLLTGALLASDWLWLARFMDWGEVKLRKLWAVAQRAWRRTPLPGRIALIAAGISLSVASTYGFFQLMQ